MPDDRKIKLVIKDHNCRSEGELITWASFDSASRVNDVGDAQLIAAYGYSAANDALLDALAVGDMILEAYIKPPGHTRFLDDPAWAGFLRNRKIRQAADGVKVGTYQFYDYNHLLERRRLKPPDGASHDEDYDTTGNVMRNLVRRHAAEDAEEARQFPGLSVEANDDEGTGSVVADVSTLVFGSNSPDWVRVNAIYEWNGYLYIGTETQEASGAYAAIYRSATGLSGTWVQVMDGTPGVYYPAGITGVHCFCEFDGDLYAGCSQDWQNDDAIIILTADGTTWKDASTLDNHSGVWALEEFDGYLYAGTTGYTPQMSETYLWRSADGAAWVAVLDATVSTGCPCSTPFDPPHVENLIVCESLHNWDDNHLYIGLQYKYSWCLCGTQYGVQDCVDNSTWNAQIRRSADGTTFATVETLTTPATHGVLSFAEFDGQLYAGTGRTRYTTFLCGGSVTADYSYGGQIWRSADGVLWDQVFGGNLESSHRSGAISGMVETLDAEANSVLWAVSGWRTGGYARVYQSSDGEEWIVVAELIVIPYAFALALIDFGGDRFVCTGCYAKTGQWQADHGDVWLIVPSEEDVEDAGVVGRYVTLLSKLQELAEQSGAHDFGIVGLNSLLYCDNDVQNFEFLVRSPQWGEDNSWDTMYQEGLTFQIERGNMDDASYIETRASRPTMLFILGPSAGEERVVEEFENLVWIDESPWSRIEGVVDAQNVDTPQARTSIALSEIEKQGPIRDLDFQVLETAYCHYTAENEDLAHPASFGLGDVVTAEFADVEAICKIEEVGIHAPEGAAVYNVTAKFDVLEIVGATPPVAVYAATQSLGLYYSENFTFEFGDPTWEKLGQTLAIDEFAIDRETPDEFQACRAGQVIYVRRPGAYGDGDWHSVFTKADAEALAGTSLTALSWVEINSSKPGTMYTTAVDTYYLANKDLWLFTSEDYGATWSATIAITSRHYQPAAIWAGYEAGDTYAAGDVLYISACTGIGGNGRIYYSIDGGATWNLKDTLSASSWRPRAMVDPTDQETSYAGDQLNGIDLAKSTNVPGVYIQVKANAGIVIGGAGAYATGWISATDGRWVRTARSTVLYRSNNGGVDWDSEAAAYTNQVIYGADDEPAKIAAGKTSSGTIPPFVDAPHVVASTDDDGVHWHDKAGVNAGVADTGGGDSIPYNCGGIAENGLYIFQ